MTPIFLRDIDGAVYRCKVTGVSVSVADYDVLPAVVVPKYVYQLVLEQL